MQEVRNKVKSRGGKETPDFCISDSKINALLENAEKVRVNGNGYLEICNGGIVIEIEIGNVFYSLDGIEEAHAQLVSMKEGDKVVYKANIALPTKNKECVIL